MLIVLAWFVDYVIFQFELSVLICVCAFFFFGGAEDGQENTNDDGPENNPQYTTVYVGNLAHEASIHFSLI